jgi:hypothetical protein
MTDRIFIDAAEQVADLIARLSRRTDLRTNVDGVPVGHDYFVAMQHLRDAELRLRNERPV